MPGNVSRWNVGKDLSFVPIRVERVAEVTFGQLSGVRSGRHRRNDTPCRKRPPESCRYDQLDVAAPRSFLEIVGT
jgi:hypothetical protein